MIKDTEPYKETKRPWARRFVFRIEGGILMNITKLLSYQQMMSAIASADINVAHCAATGLAVDLYILDNRKPEVDDIDRVIDVLNIFTQTNEIMFRDFSYVFAQDDVVDTVEMKLLRIFQALRRNRFSAIEFFEDEEFIGFQDRFGVVLKARKVGDSK